MEKCHAKSDIKNKSYQRIRRLICQNEDPYNGDLEKETFEVKSYNFITLAILVLLFIFFLHSIVYQSGAISLFK